MLRMSFSLGAKIGRHWCRRQAACLSRIACSPGAGGPATSTLLPRNLPLKHASTFPMAIRIGRAYPPLGSARCVASAAAFSAADIVADVGLMVEGEPLEKLSDDDLESLCETLYEDAKAAVRHAAAFHVEGEDRDQPPGPLELSVVLCDDPYIQGLNREWRGKDAPTDVLSFEMEGEAMEFEWDDEDEEAEDQEEEEEGSEEEVVGELSGDESLSVEGWDVGEGIQSTPATLLGDVVISLDTAARQAEERGYSLLDECRILLVHGLLHLLGYDHEQGGDAEEEMAAAEARILQSLGWKGQGLIAAAAENDESTEPGSTILSEPFEASQSYHRRSSNEIRLLALDMDGTLLDSTSNVLPSSVAAIRAALNKGVTVILATGKARPAAMAAMRKVGLCGEGLVVSTKGPGIFLQGLAVHGKLGNLIAGGTLPSDIVRQAFEFAQNQGVSVCGFLGEECVTIEMTPEVQQLHSRYYEPLAGVAPSVDAVVAGPPLRKLLFMAQPDRIQGELLPQWSRFLEGTSAAPMQAVPEMLEIVPAGWDKWVGMQALLAHLDLPVEAVMAVGDGRNDLQLVAGVGIGVAMANGVPAVREAAVAVVASNDEGGVAEAIERFIL